jgi:hypothetical protein
MATGFFIQKGERSYFVTAAHVWDALQDKSRSLSVYFNRKTFVDLRGTALKTRPRNGNRADDHIDIGVILLKGECVPPFNDIGKRAMPSSMISDRRPPSTGLYLMIGFPASKGRVNFAQDSHVSSCWPIIIGSAPGEAYSGKGLAPDTHILMPWNKRQVFGLDGKRINPSTFPGMSGSPVFRVLDGFEEGAEKGVELEGVFIEHRKASNVLVATRSFVVLDALSKLAERP